MKRVLVLAAALGMALNLVGCSSDPREGLVAAAVTDVDNAATKVTNIKVKIEDAVKKAEPGKALISRKPCWKSMPSRRLPRRCKS